MPAGSCTTTSPAAGAAAKTDVWDYSTQATRAGTAHSYAYRGRPVPRADVIAAANPDTKAAQRGLWETPATAITASVPT